MPIQARLTVRAEGTPGELDMHFRSPAGTVLDLFLTADGTIRSGEPGGAQAIIGLHESASSDLNVAAGGRTTTRVDLDVEIFTVDDVFTYTVRSGDRVVLSGPLSSRITNTSELVLRFPPGSGAWSVVAAQPLPELLKNWTHSSLPHPSLRVHGVRPREVVQIVGSDTTVIAAAAVPLGAQSVQIPWYVGRADNVRLFVRHGRTSEPRYESAPLAAVCAGNSYRLAERTPT